jgi:hypothetical protein
LILLTEHRLGYGAEAELLREYPDEAEVIRTKRKKLEGNSTFDPKLDKTIERLCDVEQNTNTTAPDDDGPSK